MKHHSNQQTRVAIIGAGIAGLAAGYELSKKGIDVQVFEKLDRPGGRMQTSSVDGYLFDSGTDFFSDNYLQMKAYAKEFDIPWVPYSKQSWQRIFRDGTAHVLHLRGVSDLFKIKVLSPGAKLRLLRWLILRESIDSGVDFFNLSSVPSALDNETAAKYLKRSLGTEINDYIVDPFVGAMQFHRTDELSAGTFLALAQAFASTTEKFIPRYTEGGIDKIAQALASKLHVTYGADIATATPTKHGIEIAFQNKSKQVFDIAIFATPAPITERLFAGASDNQRTFLRSAKYASTITVALTIPSTLSDESHCTYVPYVENKLIGSYTFEYNKNVAFERNGRGVVNVYLQDSATQTLMQEHDDSIFQRVVEELPKVCPELHGYEKDIQPLTLQRWPLAMPKFDHQYITDVQTFLKQHQGKQGIYFAGDYLNAPWTEGASRSGIRAANLILDQLNTGQETQSAA